MFSVPIVTRMVSPDEFGKSSLFILAHTLFCFFAFFGLDQAFVRFYNTELDKKKLLFNSLFFSMIVCIFLIIGIIIFQKALSFWLFGQYDPLIIVCLCLYLVFSIVNGFGMQNIRMDLRGRLYTILSIVLPLTNFICLLLLLLFVEQSFRSIVYAIVISTMLNAVLVVFFTKSVWTLRFKYFDKNLIKGLLHFGLPLVPATLLTWGLNSIDRIALRKWSSLEELGLYAAAFKVVSILGIVQTIFTTAWVPVAYKWYENKVDNAKFDIVSAVILIIMSIGFVLLVISRDIIMLFLGPEYRNASLLFVYLLFVPIMYTVSETTTLGIGFSKKTKYSLYVSIISVIISLLGNFILTPRFGARGAAISTCFSYLTFFWMRTLFSRRLWYKFDITKYAINIFLFFVLILVIEFNLSKMAEIMAAGLIILFNLFLLKKYNILSKLGIRNNSQ
jgi:O-antigen/teichoic acid export membrane protein